MTIAGRALWSYGKEVSTNGTGLVEAQASLRWNVYFICPERLYSWFQEKGNNRAYIR